MKKQILVVIMVLILGYVLLTNDFFASLVPGWHTTIYPKWIIAAFIMLLVLTFLGLLKLIKNGFWPNKK